jgi:aminoglycoside N3'-acetyltransferase
MQPVTVEIASQALTAIGLKAGDGVLVHSALQFLGKPESGPSTYLEALCRVINLPFPAAGFIPDLNKPFGTIAVPAFNFGFARGEPFDPQKTPSRGMGVFSELVRQQPGALRTSHPLQSLAALGAHAADLASRDTGCAFDSGSAFERLLDLDFKLVLLGADVQAASIIHYSEQRASVPYRYWKAFSAPVRTLHGWQTRTYMMFVRDLDLDPRLMLQPVQERLEEQGLWRSIPLNYGAIAACRLRDFTDAADHLLVADPWALVENPPDGNI